MTIAPFAPPVQSWSHSVNRAAATGTALASIQNCLFETIGGLKAVGLTVDYSCSSTVAGSEGDGVDRISAATNLVWSAAGAHSWIVLNDDTLGQLMIAFNAASASAHTATIRFSPGSLFTGGTTTAAPTATDALTLRSAAAWLPSTAAAARKVNVQRSTGGIRVFIWSAGAVHSLWVIDSVTSQVSGWDGGIVARVNGATTAAAEATINGAAWIAQHSSTLTACALSTPRRNTTASVSLAGVNIANDIDTTAGLAAFKLRVESTATTVGGMGVMRDLFLVPDTAAEGDTVPLTPSDTKEWVILGNLALPWDGSSTPLTT